jgi:hypothetical protein
MSTSARIRLGSFVEQALADGCRSLPDMLASSGRVGPNMRTSSFPAAASTRHRFDNLHAAHATLDSYWTAYRLAAPKSLSMLVCSCPPASIFALIRQMSAWPQGQEQCRQARRGKEGAARFCFWRSRSSSESGLREPLSPRWGACAASRAPASPTPDKPHHPILPRIVKSAG